jgi:hypothetical protein
MYINLKGREAKGKHDCPFILGSGRGGGGMRSTGIKGVFLLGIADLKGQFE